MDKRAEELLHDLKVTRGCRINAAERLNTRVRRMALLIAVAAGMVIALTVLPALYKLPPSISIDLSVVTLLMAVVILAVSLFQYGTNDAVTAEQHHRCSLELGELLRELRNKAETIDENGLTTIRVRYDSVLQKYSAAHHPLDLTRYEVEHRDEFALSPVDKAQAYLRLGLSGNVLYGLLIVAVIVLFLWLLFGHVLPSRVS
jgi:SMODS and SLOG-associating 2TM effector domain family 5